MRIIITGATGLLGSVLYKSLYKKNEIIVVTGNPEKSEAELPGAFLYLHRDNLNELNEKDIYPDAVINLAGENIGNHRWSEKYKKQILQSRVKTTENLINLIDKSPFKPKVFISASAVGIYGSGLTDEVYTEKSETGNDFLAEVCKKWESEALKTEQMYIRTVVLRFGVILSANGGALQKMLNPFKYFVGGYIGSGKQWISWIHIADVVNVIKKALTESAYKGIINVVSPEPVTNKELTEKIAKIIKKPALFCVPSFVIKAIFGEMSGIVLKGQKVAPERLNELKYEFLYKNSDSALLNLIKSS